VRVSIGDTERLDILNEYSYVGIYGLIDVKDAHLHENKITSALLDINYDIFP
jgi:hypothetical protein